MPFPKLPGEDIINSWYPILLALFCGLLYGIRSYFRGGQCQSRERLKGKTTIVTGGNSGIGKETVRDFAARGARVILACRDVAKGEEALKDIAITTKVDKVKVMKLDLASFVSVRKFVEDFNENEDRLDILVNNAGVMCHPQAKTEDGLEQHFGVNYLGHFLLTNLLLNELKESAPARIINVTALSYKLGVIDFDDLQFETKEYQPGEAYSQSKLAVMLFTHRLSKELEGSNVTVNVAHPGVVNTDGHRHMPFKQSTVVRVSFSPFMWMFMKGVKDGAQTIIHCAVAKEEENVSGKYYADCLMAETEANAKDDEVANRLWDVSLKLTGLMKEAVKEK